MEELKKEVELAIDKYGTDCVDIIKNEDDGLIYGVYHSRHHSFTVSKGYAINDLDEIERYCDRVGIGYCLE